MFKKISACLPLLMLFFNAFAQKPDSLLIKLSLTKQDTNRLNIQLKLAEFYLFKPGELNADLDSALYYISEVKSLSSSIGATDQSIKAFIIEGKLYIEKRDFRRAENTFTTITENYHRTGDKMKEAAMWDLLGESIGSADLPNLELRLRAFSKAYNVYLKSYDELLAAQELNKIADVHLNLGKSDQAELELRSVIEKYKSLKYPKIYQPYYLLGVCYFKKKDLLNMTLSLYECVNAFDKDKNRREDEGFLYYETLANFYEFYNKFDDSILIYVKCLDLAIKLNDRTTYYRALRSMLNVCDKNGNYRLGLLKIQQAYDKFPPLTNIQKCNLLSKKMLLNVHSNNMTSAGMLISDFSKSYMREYNQLRIQPVSPDLNDYFILLNKPLLEYYMRKKQWTDLSYQLKLYEQLNSKAKTVDTEVIYSLYKFEIDSVNGNFSSAYTHVQRVRKYNDSLYLYKLKTKKDEIDAGLSSLIKEESIQNLNRKAALQSTHMLLVNKQRNITLVGIFVAGLIATILYFSYKRKQRLNLRLEEQQLAINKQNESLSGLLTEKENLIINLDTLLKQQENLTADKEWLLKEVHHRVKNNLQIVMSLLYTQSAYLKNSAAIEALKDSQNRVHAISIIHQKLYNKENVATVILSDYIKDLVYYLQNSYNTDKMRIRFKQSFDDIDLDISQAVPIGLIINEAVTNSIKYAFINATGEIHIEGRQVGDDMVSLSVTDNGIGFPDDFNIDQTTSLGMEMMKALSKQLGGTFNVISNIGVKISILFTIDKNFKTLPEEIVHQTSDL